MLTIPASKNYKDLYSRVIQSLKLFSKDKISFFDGVLVEQQTAHYTIESIVSVLRTYGLSVKNIWNQQAGPLFGTGAIPYSNNTLLFGKSVCMSEEATTIAVGAPIDNNAIGATWVFIRTGEIWTQQGSKLVGSGFIGSPLQGSSTAISSNGATLAIGGPGDDGGVGAVWIFVRNGNFWSQQGTKLIGSAYTTYSRQGTSVSLSSDGNTLALGGPVDFTNIGAVWVFTRTAGVWTQQGPKLLGSGHIGSSAQGSAVALSGSGNTLVVGGPDDNLNNGAVWIFTRTAGVWTQQGSKLVGSMSQQATQGISVSASYTGDTIVFGGPEHSTLTGASWVFTRDILGVWTQQGLPKVGSASDISQQGLSVSMSKDGNTYVIGGQNGIWIFERDALGIWTQVGTKLISEGEVTISQQGASVAISTLEANYVVSGSPSYNSGLGAAWIFKKNINS